MMRTVKSFLSAALLATVGLVPVPQTLSAQDAVQGLAWKGTAPASLTGNFYLYNVGTGKFLKQSGEWGTQGCLKYQGFGTPLTLESVTGGYAINSGMYTPPGGGSSEKPQYLGLNIPDYTSGGTWGSDKTYGLICDTRVSSSVPGTNSRYLTFEEIANGNGSKVYRIKETLDNSSKGTATFYWGGRYGIDFRTGKAVDYKDTCDVATFCHEKYNGNANDTLTAYKDYYSWILVPESELTTAHTASVESGGGLVANLSYLFKDPYFDRNRTGFDDAWKTGTFSGTAADYHYLWLSKTTKTESWETPVFQKVTVDSKQHGEYSFASFEGNGYAYTEFTAPEEGYYDVELRGFRQGNNDAYFFVSTTKPGEGTPNTTKALLPQYTGDAFEKVQKIETNYKKLAAPGQLLFENKDNAYTVKLQLYATKGQTVYAGVFKKAATKSAAFSNSYYYDTDYVGIDNLQLYYVGRLPFVLDEDRDADQYMRDADFPGTGDNPQIPVVYLKRTFTLNKWNTLVLPIDLTAAQVKEAFGEDTKLAELKGRGAVTGKPSIDFQTVSLETATAKVIEKGKMYLIKPVKDGTATTCVFLGKNYDNVKMYTIGRRTLDGEKLVDPITAQGQNGDGSTYPQVDFMGTYVSLAANAENGTKGTKKGDYLFSGGNMYHLASSVAIKGFRGWFRDNTGLGSIKFNISDGEITSIDEVTRNDAAASGAVYTVDGVKVRANAASLEGLPEGIYIFNGRKHIVK